MAVPGGTHDLLIVATFARKALKAEVDFPSGNLLVSESFLFEAFNKEILSAYLDGDKSDASRQFALHQLATKGIVQMRHVLDDVHLARETADILNFATRRPSSAGEQPAPAAETPSARWKELNIIDRETLRSLIQAHRTGPAFFPWTTAV